MQQPLTHLTETALEAPGTGAEVPEPKAARPLARRVSFPRWIGQLLSNRKAALGVAIIAFLLGVAFVGPHIWPGDPMAPDYSSPPMSPPSPTHWFGTDQMSHDVFKQMVDGTGPTLLVAIAIGFLATAISIIGVVGGYLGGWVDEFLNMFTNIFLVIPAFPLMIVIASWVHVKNDIPAIIIISAVSWPGVARVLRSQTMSLRQRDYVQAAIVSGESAWRIVLFEILPNMISLVVSQLIGLTMAGLGAAAGLAFLGLGNLDEANWFTILYWAQNASALQQGAWWTFVIPGSMIALVGMALTLINYGIDEISNPRLAKQSIKPLRRLKMPAPAAAPPAGEAIA